MQVKRSEASISEVEAAYRPAGEHELRVPSLLRCGLMILVAKSLLTVRGFGPTIGWVRRRVTAIPAAALVDEDAVRASERKVALACALYPGRAQCLERSLVLYYVLRLQGVDVRFVNGVKVDPFAAHAWIEYRGEPLNDVAEHVELYTPLPDDKV